MKPTETPGQAEPLPDLNLKNAATYVGVSVSTMRRLIASGEVPVRRIRPRVIRIRRADLDALGH